MDAAPPAASPNVDEDEAAVPKVDHFLRFEAVAFPHLVNRPEKPQDALVAVIAILEIQSAYLTDEVELDVGIERDEKDLGITPVPCLGVVADFAGHDLPMEPGVEREAQENREVQARQAWEADDQALCDGAVGAWPDRGDPVSGDVLLRHCPLSIAFAGARRFCAAQSQSEPTGAG